MYLSTSTSTEDFPEMYLSTFQVLYKLYLSTDVLKYKVLLPGSARGWVMLMVMIRVTWGKAPPFGDDLSLTYLHQHLKNLDLCNKLYVMCIMTECHIRSDNMSAEIRLLIAALKMSQILSCGAKRPGGL